MINETDRQEVVRLLKEWHTHRDIAEMVNVSVWTVSNIRNEIESEKVKKVISLYDIHYPMNIDLYPVLEFISYEQPDEIVLGWDQLDLFSISKYYDWDIEDWVYKAHKEIIWFMDILNEIKRAAPKAKIVWLTWNHDTRVWDYIDKNPERELLLDYEKEYWDLIDEYYAYNEFYKVGKLYYTHGIYHNDAHAKKTLLNTQKNVRYGHLHVFQAYTGSTLVWEEPHSAVSIPCLCELNPWYMKNRPSGRTNGFNIAYIRDDWSFNDYTIIITDWHFTYWNKTY